MGKIKAEYIWIDGTEPTPLLRSKTKVMDAGAEPPEWGFDGSSTNQATGDASDCALKPVFVPARIPSAARATSSSSARSYNADGTPHADEHPRRAAAEAAEKYKDLEPWYGMEQEYTLMKGGRPYGFPPENGYPAPQGPYYCGTGASHIMGRELVERSYGRVHSRPASRSAASTPRSCRVSGSSRSVRSACSRRATT